MWKWIRGSGRIETVGGPANAIDGGARPWTKHGHGRDHGDGRATRKVVLAGWLCPMPPYITL